QAQHVVLDLVVDVAGFDTRELREHEQVIALVEDVDQRLAGLLDDRAVADVLHVAELLDERLAPGTHLHREAIHRLDALLVVAELAGARERSAVLLGQIGEVGEEVHKASEAAENSSQLDISRAGLGSRTGFGLLLCRHLKTSLWEPDQEGRSRFLLPY